MNFSRHAKNRMRQMKVTPAEVEALVAAPDSEDHDAQGRRRVVGVVRGARVRVVLALEDETRVVSVHPRR
ncbi:MAG: DUF4258 domain-containing protein [Miltoncostaeaceae bacterium]